MTEKFYEDQHEVQEFPVEAPEPTPEPTPAPAPVHKITTTETRDQVRLATIILRSNSAVNLPGTFVNDALKVLEKLLADIEALLPK